MRFTVAPARYQSDDLPAARGESGYRRSERFERTVVDDQLDHALLDGDDTANGCHIGTDRDVNHLQQRNLEDLIAAGAVRSHNGCGNGCIDGYINIQRDHQRSGPPPLRIVTTV